MFVCSALLFRVDVVDVDCSPEPLPAECKAFLTLLECKVLFNYWRVKYEANEDSNWVRFADEEGCVTRLLHSVVVQLPEQTRY